MDFKLHCGWSVFSLQRYGWTRKQGCHLVWRRQVTSKRILVWNNGKAVCLYIFVTLQRSISQVLVIGMMYQSWTIIVSTYRTINELESGFEKKEINKKYKKNHLLLCVPHIISSCIFFIEFQDSARILFWTMFTLFLLIVMLSSSGCLRADNP